MMIMIILGGGTVPIDCVLSPDHRPIFCVCIFHCPVIIFVGH